MDKPPSEEVLERRSDDCFGFVERGWFQVIATCVILSNTGAIIVEIDEPDMKETLYVADQAMLCFYVFELICRACHLRSNFCLGPAALLAWNGLDLVVVFAGIFDQWLLPLLPIGRSRPLRAVLSVLRLLRLLRVLKIVRVFLETDLSWTERPKFQSFIGAVIAFNALLMGFETDIEWWAWFYIEQFLLCIYVFELSVRMKRFGLHFFCNEDIVWNVLDSIIVGTSVLDSWLVPLFGIFARALSGAAKEKGKATGMSLGQVMMLLRMLRLMRILRLVKLIKSVRPLFILVTGVVHAFQGVVWVMVLTVGVLYAMGIMTTRLIGHGMIFPHGQAPATISAPFRNVPESMFTLFRVMNGGASAEEAEAIDELMSTLPSIKFAFVFFMVTSSWTLLSILTAVVSDNMIQATGSQEKEMAMATDDEDRESHLKDLEKLFSTIDVSGSGVLVEKDLEAFLRDKKNAAQCAKSCHVPVREVVDVMQTLSVDGSPVAMKDFLDCMVDVAKSVTMKDVMKMEARFIKYEHFTGKSFQDLEAKTGIVEEKLNDVLAFEPQSVDAVSNLRESVQQLMREQDRLEEQSVKAINNLAELIETSNNDLNDLGLSVQAVKARALQKSGMPGTKDAP